jgi:hypothetical protein
MTMAMAMTVVIYFIFLFSFCDGLFLGGHVRTGCACDIQRRSRCQQQRQLAGDGHDQSSPSKALYGSFG